jgi:hypothetical protein
VLLIAGADQSKAHVVVPVPGVVVVTNRRTKVLRIVVPGTAAYHAVGAIEPLVRYHFPFLHILFLKRFVLARLIAAKTLLVRSAAFASVIFP